MAQESWSNFSGRVVFTPQARARPKSEAELCAVVREASRAGSRVRVAGSGHSFTPLVESPGTLVSLDDWQGIESVDCTVPNQELLQVPGYSHPDRRINALWARCISDRLRSRRW